MADRLYCALAEFKSPEDLLAATRKAREAGYRDLDAFTPFPVEGLDRILRFPRPTISFVGLGGAIAGASTALAMQFFTNSDYPLNVGGRPIYPISAFAVVTFELTILFCALAMLFAMLWQNGLPRLSYPVFNGERFHRVSKDRFFLCVGADDARFDASETLAFLSRIGALSVELVPE
ncbi:DUF3341 domain-containing protein [Bradyrhizobium genosp. L]|uniref:DUF3341 domain-containing protein n=1 Tax=Bradyrhizobium genosp. L TaxID=83637 RepID=UPI0018A28012|nr:DUF3341 domain-containing protein [Bradyrhizobium genosp. L]QPF83846.1 DUF3341 domain-containing protein [Bradyrhizobium genosp. L]